MSHLLKLSTYVNETSINVVGSWNFCRLQVHTFIINYKIIDIQLCMHILKVSVDNTPHQYQKGRLECLICDLFVNKLATMLTHRS